MRQCSHPDERAATIQGLGRHPRTVLAAEVFLNAANRPVSGVAFQRADRAGGHWHQELACRLCGLRFNARREVLEPILAKLVDLGVPQIELLNLRRLYS